MLMNSTGSSWTWLCHNCDPDEARQAVLLAWCKSCYIDLFANTAEDLAEIEILRDNLEEQREQRRDNSRRRKGLSRIRFF